ncbi:mitochondrial thiamine pyrophosphate carrier-like [Corticium candelabrum]|uniref:mitochondrial thiamine pyrophosphate carrier-like n=1 Tax=Corticium candelabrum TaxID=121492 RepID=UPI002E271EA9|nr:mitochondrial thiamine pyrophosphate carrier-like [Corticium candelabrum]
MVGYRGDSKLSSRDYALAGALAGAVTRATVSPLDVLKIRFQLQVENFRHNRAFQERTPKYRGLLQAVQVILQEEGVRAFWKGHIPGQLLSIVYGMVQFTTFEYLTWSLSLKAAEWKRPGVHFVSGGVSGCVATFCVQPFDLLRTRLVSQGEPKIYQNLAHATLTIFQREGGKAFYKVMRNSKDGNHR